MNPQKTNQTNVNNVAPNNAVKPAQAANTQPQVQTTQQAQTPIQKPATQPQAQAKPAGVQQPVQTQQPVKAPVQQPAPAAAQQAAKAPVQQAAQQPVQPQAVKPVEQAQSVQQQKPVQAPTAEQNLKAQPKVQIKMVGHEEQTGQAPAQQVQPQQVEQNLKAQPKVQIRMVQPQQVVQPQQIIQPQVVYPANMQGQPQVYYQQPIMQPQVIYQQPYMQQPVQQYVVQGQIPVQPQIIQPQVIQQTGQIPVAQIQQQMQVQPQQVDQNLKAQPKVQIRMVQVQPQQPGQATNMAIPKKQETDIPMPPQKEVLGEEKKEETKPVETKTEGDNIVPTGYSLTNENNQNINETINPIKEDLNNIKESKVKKKRMFSSNVSLLNLPATDSELLNEFVGKNNFKISNKMFNFCAFLFQSFYCFYRKMPITGLIVFIIDLVILNFVKYKWAVFIVGLILSVIFNKLYVGVATKKIEKYKKINEGDTYTLKQTCAKKGGYSSGMLLLAIIFEPIIILVLMILGYLNGLVSFLDDYGIKLNLSDKIVEVIDRSNKMDPDYNNISISDSSVVLSDEIKITVPYVFTKGMYDTTHKMTYAYLSTKPILNSCKFEISVAKRYSSKDTLINAIAKYEKVSKIEEYNEWKYIYKKKKTQKDYYYVTEINNKVFLLTYTDKKNAPSDCDSYRTKVIDSITSAKEVNTEIDIEYNEASKDEKDTKK